MMIDKLMSREDAQIKKEQAPDCLDQGKPHVHFTPHETIKFCDNILASAIRQLNGTSND